MRLAFRWELLCYKRLWKVNQPEPAGKVYFNLELQKEM